jgi:nucleotide-binding universal stress UspA family protein
MTIPAPETASLAPKTFVVPLDGSDFANRAVPLTADLTQRFGADMVLMTAPTALDHQATDPPPVWLQAVVDDVGGAPIETVVAGTNDPVAAMLALLDSHPDPVIAMATHGRGVLGTAALGGVAQEIVRCADVPMLLFGKHCVPWPRWSGPVLVCHDGSPAADAVLAPASTWARTLDLPIAVVHVFHPLDVPTAEAPTAAIQGALDALGPDTDVHVVRNYSAADGIHAVAERLSASLVVTSTHGRTGLARVVLGSVATEVVRNSRCPVLIARPRDLDG